MTGVFAEPMYLLNSCCTDWQDEKVPLSTSSSLHLSTLFSLPFFLFLAPSLTLTLCLSLSQTHTLPLNLSCLLALLLQYLLHSLICLSLWWQQEMNRSHLQPHCMKTRKRWPPKMWIHSSLSTPPPPSFSLCLTLSVSFVFFHEVSHEVLVMMSHYKHTSH